MYANHLETEGGFIYKGHTKDFAQQNYVEKADQEIYIPGDGTVPTTSSVIPGIKWAADYLEKSEKSTKEKPINFVEVCSQSRIANRVSEDRNTYIGL